MKFKNCLYTIFTTAFMLSLTVSVLPSNFHTYHTSLTRIDYDEKEKLVEISIQLFTHDLVPILEKRAKKNIDLEKTSDIDGIILKFLTENFVLKDKQGETKKLVWVGKEMQADTVFVYVEVSLNQDFDGFNLQNTLFFENFAEQTNFVIIRNNYKKADLLYKVGDKFKEIKFSKDFKEKNRDKFSGKLISN